MGVYYFDNNATTMISLEASKSMAYVNYYYYGNPSSIYSLGLDTKRIVEDARSTIKSSIFNGMTGSIIFTSGATEGNNAVINSALKINSNRRTIITSSVEHPSVSNPIEMYQNQGYNVIYLPVSERGLDDSLIKECLSSDVALVSLMRVNNETGMIFPVEQIFDCVKRYDRTIICHSDCVQAIGKTSLPVNSDFITISAHKFHGPKGIGCIFKKDSTPFVPFILGGGQENGQRSGTENVAAIKGLEVAAVETTSNKDSMKKLSEYQVRLERFLKDELNGYIIGENSDRVCGVTNVGFSGVDGNQLELLLNAKRVFVSTGSACSSQKAGLSPVISAMNIPKCFASSIRISMSKYTNSEEVDYLIHELKDCVLELQHRSKRRNNYGSID